MSLRLCAAGIGVAVAALVLAANTAEARPRHYVRHHHHRLAPKIQDRHPAYSDVVTIQTAAGPVHVASEAANRFRGFIADVVSRGFRGPVHCYSATGHVRHSLHHTGRACDFAQRGWGKTVRPMYHVADLARKWGLRDGCTFRDCGHIDIGRPVRSRYASR